MPFLGHRARKLGRSIYVDDLPTQIIAFATRIAVFISGQKRGVFGAIKRELRRRSAIEPVIGHMKADGHLGRISREPPVMPPTPSSPPSDTTSNSSSPG